MVVFTEGEFERIPDAESRRIAAQMANEYIEKIGIMLFGSITNQGYYDFTSNKKETDTHVIISCTEEQMQSQKPAGRIKKIPIERQRDQETAKDMYIKRLRDELQIKGNKTDGRT